MDQIMGANRYSCENSSGAVRLPLWRTNSHNMAISPSSFFAFLVTLLAVTNTVMLTLGISCTQTLVTRLGWWYGAVFALSGAGVVQTMAIFRSKSGLYGGLFPGWGSDLESVLWAIPHPCMGKHYLLPLKPSPVTYLVQWGFEYGFLG